MAASALKRLFVTYNTTLPSSSPSSSVERLFSSVGLIDACRNKLTDKMFQIKIVVLLNLIIYYTCYCE